MNESVTTRFAPSPTGRLHLGHAYSAIRAHDFARENGGRFLLRFEDIDPGRVRPEYYDAIEEDLAWLGLEWDGEPVRQSRRLPLYEDTLETLKMRGLVYPCFCTRKEIAAEIAASASAPHPPPSGPDGALYPGTCRHLSEAERQRRMAREPHGWRLDMGEAAALAGPLSWEDAEAGLVEATPEIHGDVVLARKDAPTSYHLAVTVDDAAQGISDVVRGRDLFEATHVHRLLQALLGRPTPRYHHHALIADGEGKRLAKRDDARSLLALREAGIEGGEVAAALRADPPDISILSPAD
ncbi:tRNA glutamyl-Q(34) synthetase GluQRS [Parasphingopyxis marina]|uniref:tRNA glutamyl-Q(34) synthetase GluQRS n=1 Tax=Parasphingopyxis marina TaxID=2761622 RepID=A0A842HW50_9SPHN|nr:tRNA glutamyl-Q(34) synthetase GluQRS [Parasphingopyxis marina]MBC2776170.1 tRNA glutamyl-Q(34) synthetase GluQRS [Parasphingopyxis marina]